MYYIDIENIYYKRKKRKRKKFKKEKEKKEKTPYRKKNISNFTCSKQLPFLLGSASLRRIGLLLYANIIKKLQNSR